MLSYQHEYHAGNHGDVLKHICLVTILDSLLKKDKPFTLIDTHSSAGRFNLKDERLVKTGEAENGIEKLIKYCSKANNIPETLKRYIDIQYPYFKNEIYAGSAELERFFLRNGDICHLVEKHPTALQSLEENIRKPLITESGENRYKGKTLIHNSDSYKTLSGLVPPIIKRGLILCDPSYEDRSDYVQVTEALKNAHKKWNTAIIALWYPILDKKRKETSQMLCELEDYAKLGLNPCDSVKFELNIFDPENIPASMNTETGPHMLGSGMFIINPPWLLKEKMDETIPVLEKVFTSK